MGATGTSFSGTRPDGTVLGFADTHLHITADQRAGGRVIYGRPFAWIGGAGRRRARPRRRRQPRRHGEPAAHRAAVRHARRPRAGRGSRAGRCTTRSPTSRPTRSGSSGRGRRGCGSSCADGGGRRAAPDRAAPVARVRRAGARSGSRSGDLRALQRYVDAQSGGAGRGVVPARRRARGRHGGSSSASKLAVVVGVESSNPSRLRRARRQVAVHPGRRRPRHRLVPAPRRAQPVHRALVRQRVRRRRAEARRRASSSTSTNRLETGRYFATGALPRAPGKARRSRRSAASRCAAPVQYFPATEELLRSGVPTYPPGRQCNVRGLTPLGAYLVRRLMAAHMLIEVDHLSERARDRVLALAQARHYPVISSHNGTGGAWTAASCGACTPSGASRRPPPARRPSWSPDPASDPLPQPQVPLRRRARHRHGRVRVAARAPRADARAHPLRYPFTAYAGHVTFVRERTGERVFDLNSDGVAQYGLMADLVADMQRRRAARRRSLCCSAPRRPTWRCGSGRARAADRGSVPSPAAVAAGAHQ